jgi:hypothetical protein
MADGGSKYGPIHYAYTDFSSGEIAPLLQARTEAPYYKSGLATLRNFIVFPNGSVGNRPGTRYCGTVKNSSDKTIVRGFVFSDDQAYVMEFGNYYIRFYYQGALQYYKTPGHTTSAFEVVTPYLADDLQFLRIVQSADVLYLTHPDYPPQTLTRLNTRWLYPASGSWVLAAYDFTNGPFRPENTGATTITPSATSGSITLTASSAIFVEQQHVGSLWQIQQYRPMQSNTDTYTTSAKSGTAIACGGTWRIVTHGTWTGTIKVQKSLNNSTWTDVRMFASANDINFNTFGTETDSQFWVRVSTTGTTSGTATVNLSCDPFFWIGVVKITGVGGA